MIRTTDRFIAPSRGTKQEVFDFFDKHPPARRPDSDRVVHHAFTRAAELGLDFSLVMSRIFDETGAVSGDKHRVLVSDIYSDRLNIGGLGVTGGRDEKLTFQTPEDAVDAYLAHLGTYLWGPKWDKGVLSYRDDPRYDATPRDWMGSVQTLQDLEGKWFTKKGGAENSATRGNDVFDVGDQKGSSMSKVTIAGLGEIEIDIPVEIRLIPASQKNQRPGIKMTPASWVQHETGNTRPGANADAERRYLEQGAPDSSGRSQLLSYHFTVDDTKAIQLLPVDEVAWHGGDGAGPCNFSGIACELCVGSTVNWAKARINAAKLAAAITKALGNIPVRQHNSCSGKDCPHFMRSDGYWSTFTTNVERFKGGEKPAPPTEAYAKPDIPDWLIEDRDALDDTGQAPGDHDYKGVPVYGLLRTYTAVRETPRLQLFSRGSKRVGPDIAKGEEFTGMYWAKSGTRRYVITPYGTRVDMGDLDPYLTVRERS